MVFNSYTSVIVVLIATVLVTTTVSAKNPMPCFNNKIPESILTPETVATKIGTLDFLDGIPNKKAEDLLFANLDLNRGLQAFLNERPTF